MEAGNPILSQKTLESTQRRRDIYQALTLNMGEIFAFFLHLIMEHFQSVKSLREQSQDTNVHVRVVQVVLLTLTGFIEWVSISHIMANEGRLLQILCLLLDDESFQAPAAECLLQIVNRKGHVEERMPLLVLFSSDVMNCIFKAADAASSKSLDERHYNFLKRLTLVLTGLGSQVCILWGKDDGLNGRPPNFAIYLDAILTFSRHPSLTLVHYANSLWMSFFRHEHISKDKVFLTFVPKWLECTAPKITRVSYPLSRCTNTHETAAYACLDYDSEEEFAQFFHQCRSELLQTFRQATLVVPLMTFTYVENWLVTRIQKSMLEQGIECNYQSATYLEWEALSQLLESVLSRILVPTERPSIASGLRLLEICLNYEPSDPLLLSTLLSCVSALFVFLSMTTAEGSASLLPRVLDKIFAALVFSQPGQAKDSRSRVVKNVRMHAASLMVKIAQRYPLLLLPVFDQVYATVQGLSKDSEQLSRLERVTLQEALLLISNHFCDYERQTRFIGEVIGTGAEEWIVLSSKAFKSPLDFMAFVGLDSPPVEPSSDDLNGQNRSHMLFYVNLFLAAVKRCSWPEDPDRAARGGFVVAHTETGNPVCRNPATPHIIPLIPHFLMLLKVFNGLWTPEALAAVSEGYRGAHTMLEVDRANVLGTPITASFVEHVDVSHPRAQTPLDRMQHFLTMVHDTTYHILGNTGPSLGRDFYQMEGLVPNILATMFSNLEAAPDYRLRPLVRAFLKPFVCSCPPVCYETVLLPVLAQICPYMFTHLNNKWRYLTLLYESRGMDEENTDAQEMLEDMLNRTITREYLDVLKAILVGGSTEIVLNAMDQDDMECTRTNTTSLQAEVISKLGTLTLRNEVTCQPVALCVLRGLCWNDSTTSMKATNLAAPMVRQLASDGSLTPEVAAHIMTSVLQALQLHGQHEGNLSSLLILGAQLYEILRPLFPSITEVMSQIPNYNPQDLQKLDEKILTANQKGNKFEKAKRDIFKKLTSQLIGRNVSQLFRKEIRIADLPRLGPPRRQKNARMDETESDVGLCTLFKE
ncbi:exportin-5 isoform X2 [Periplaneta americana]|uniref:exportin-5 isoform X2 n=1 Tax=Periplaneta americana TaxID=6978 RepID=UPI0037E891FD